MFGRFLCNRGWHKWEYHFTVTETVENIFSTTKNNYDMKQCARCKVWNIPLSNFKITENDLGSMNIVSNTSIRG